METIRNYLETMFLNLPNTPEVYKAKNELWQMMEDKYTELKNEGKSENEAVGTVIAEFGNLDELAEDLGISQIIHSSQTAAPSGTPFTLENAKAYLSDSARHAYLKSLGILLCIISVCSPIFFCAAEALVGESDSIEMLGVVLMFVLIAAGVGLLVFSRTRMNRWNYLEQGNFVTDFATTEYIHHEMENYKNTHALLLTIGIMTCILCVLPPIIMDAFSAFHGEFWEDCSGGFVIAIAAIGVFLIVMSSTRLGGYRRLLRLNSQDTVGGNYVPNQQEKTQYINPTVATVMSVYWPTVTCLYLIWSFLSFDWWITWIIWPIAAIINAVIDHTLKN